MSDATPRTVTLTAALIHGAATEKHGWRRAQIEALGLKYPPRKGWIERLVGKSVSVEVWERFVAERKPSARADEANSRHATETKPDCHRCAPSDEKPESRPNRVPFGIAVAHCTSCGESGQETLPNQWTGEDVPPWRGRTPRCGFCGEELTRTVDGAADALAESRKRTGAINEVLAQPKWRLNMDRYVTVGVEEVVAETAMALLCRIDGEEHWIPRSQIEGNGDDVEKGDEDVELDITQWIADQKGIEVD